MLPETRARRGQPELLAHKAQRGVTAQMVQMAQMVQQGPLVQTARQS